MARAAAAAATLLLPGHPEGRYLKCRPPQASPSASRVVFRQRYPHRLPDITRRLTALTTDPNRAMKDSRPREPCATTGSPPSSISTWRGAGGLLCQRGCVRRVERRACPINGSTNAKRRVVSSAAPVASADRPANALRLRLAATNHHRAPRRGERREGAAGRGPSRPKSTSIVAFRACRQRSTSAASSSSSRHAGSLRADWARARRLPIPGDIEARVRQ